MILCDYGCDQEAKYQFKNGKWCCSKHYLRCDNSRKNRSGINNPFFNKNHSEKTKFILRKATLNQKIIGRKRTTIKQFNKKFPIFSKVEEMKYNPDKYDEKEIQVHCKNHNCPNSKEKGGWFTPSRDQLGERIRSIEYGNGGCYLYCCDRCKDECPLFNLHSDPNKTKKELYTSEEYQTWRKEVFNRNGYYCEYCGDIGNHVHHSRPQKLEPGFVLDPDFGVVCCSECHYKYGHVISTECSTGNLAKRICK